MNLNQLFNKIIETGNKKQRKTACFVLAKLLEEAGEFAQASLAKNGDINPKKLKHPEQVFEEAADTIICVLDTIGRIYKHEITAGKLTEDKITKKIAKWIPIKMKKWKIVEGIK